MLNAVKGYDAVIHCAAWTVVDMAEDGDKVELVRKVNAGGTQNTADITPELTCYWQIAPNRNDISFDDWMKLDMKYIEERSFWVDWKIIFMTVKATVFRQGR